MKKHPEKYWFGSMILLLAFLLVALFEKVDVPSRASVEDISKEKVGLNVGSLVDSPINSKIEFTR